MMDTKDLRRLAQAATPGPWKMLPVGDGRQKFAVADSEFLSILTVTDEGGATFGTVRDDADAKFIAAANPAAISELLDRLEAAENENAKLRIALAEKVTSETTLRDLSVGNGSINATFEGGAVQLMVDALADQFVESGAPNYIEMQFHSKATGPLLFTLQRVDGKTPHQLRAEAEQERDALRAELSKQQALTDAAQHIAEVAQSRANQLQAKIEAMEQQEPVAWFEKANQMNAWFLAYSRNPRAETRPLYTLPGAQTQGEEK